MHPNQASIEIDRCPIVEVPKVLKHWINSVQTPSCALVSFLEYNSANNYQLIYILTFVSWVILGIFLMGDAIVNWLKVYFSVRSMSLKNIAKRQLGITIA